MHYSPVSPILDNILHHKNNTSNIRKTSPKQISDYLLNPLRRSYKFSYILIIPKTFAIELSKIIIRQIVAKYLINTLYSFFSIPQKETVQSIYQILCTDLPDHYSVELYCERFGNYQYVKNI